MDVKIKKKYLILGVVIFVCLVIGVAFLLKDTDEELREEEKIKIIKNEHFDIHNTGERTEKIEYIVVHYSGEAVDAKTFIDRFNMYDHMESSVDYFIDFNGDIYQYNMDIDNRYSWAIGGTKEENSKGGYLFGTVTSKNSINLEMCVDADTLLAANQTGWRLNQETIDSTLELIKYLMEKYEISADKVVRHYDVNGKYCPGIIGWNTDSGSDDEWNRFKEALNS